MSRDERLAQLRADVRRWRGRLSEAESTYCQGVANKAAKHFEALMKQLAEQRITVKGLDLGSMLAEVKYGGGAQAIDKLPFGTVTQMVIRLTRYDTDLAEACPPEVRVALTNIVDLRNETTHELAPERMRASTEGLLDLIEYVLDQGRFAALF